MRQMRPECASEKRFAPPDNPGGALGAHKKSKIAAILENIVMLLPSLVFIVLNIVCGLSIKGVFAGGNEFNSIYNGIYLWELVFTFPQYFTQSFSVDACWAFAELIPLFLFSVSVINVVVLAFCAVKKRYGKTYNAILCGITFALAIATLFLPYIYMRSVASFVGAADKIGLAAYFRYIVNPQYTTLFIAPVAGVLHLVFAIIFAAVGRNKQKGGTAR